MRKVNHPAEQICDIMNRIIKMGMGTITGGNVSVLDDEGNVWMSPTRLIKSTLKPNDVAKYLPDGSLDSENKGSIEAIINIGIHKARPDLKGIVHGHTPGSLSFMFMHRPPRLNTVAGIAFNLEKVAYTPFEMPGSSELRDVVVNAFKGGCDVVYLENHGIFAGGKDLFNAFAKMEAAEFISQINLSSHSLPNGIIHYLSDEQMEAYSKSLKEITIDKYESKTYSSEELNVRDHLCFMAKTAYEEHLISTLTGSLSIRLNDDEFIMTPKNCDYLNLDKYELIKVSKGKAEANKEVHEDILVHQAIYEEHEDVSSVVISTPYHSMGYAITDAPIDRYADFEFFMNVHNVKKLPFMASAKMIAQEISIEHPVIVVSNQYIVSAGIGNRDSVRTLTMTECLNLMAKCTGQINVSGNSIKSIEHKAKLDKRYLKSMKK